MGGDDCRTRFDPVSGEPTRGPAREPLAVLSVRDRGAKIVVG